MSEKDSKVTTLDDVAAEVVAPKKGKEAVADVKVNGNDAALSGKKKMLTIHATGGEDGQDAVPVGVNGYIYLIPRGKPCLVPVEVIEVLENAVETHMFSTGTGVEARQAPRYAFSVNG